MTLTITIDRSGHAPYSRFSWTEISSRWTGEAGRLVKAELKKHAPVGKGPTAGKLRDSIRYRSARPSGGVTITFYSDAPYARYVLEGTRPHEIVAHGRALHWFDKGGQSHFARRVNHPGTKPNPFPKRAVSPLVPVLRSSFAAAFRTQLEAS